MGQQGAERASAIQQVGNGTQQVAQKIASTWDCSDVEHDLVQVNHKPKNIEVERAQHKIDEAATRIRTYHRQGYVLRDLRRSSVSGHGAVQNPLSHQLVPLNGEVRDADQTVHAIASTVAPLHEGTEGMRNLGWRWGLGHGAGGGHGERTEGQQGEDCGEA